MVTPVVISPGVYTDPQGTSQNDTTNVAVAAGSKVVAVITWYENVTLTSVSGGGLTWTIEGQSAGSTYHVAIATADAPAGLASGTTITFTLSGSGGYARFLRLLSVDGLELNSNGAVDVDTYSGELPSADNWSVGLTTTVADTVMFGFLFQDFYTGGVTPAVGSTELFESTPGPTFTVAYKELPSAGAATVGGTYSSGQPKCQCAVAFKTASAAPPSEGSTTGTHVWTGTATGARASQGSTTGGFAWSGSAAGTNIPAVPGNLQATAISATEIDLTWDAVFGATGYDLERDGVIIVTDHPTTSYSDTGLTPETEYAYRVRAVG